MCTQKLEEEDRYMEVDYAWPTKLLKLAKYELLFQMGLLTRWVIPIAPTAFRDGLEN